MRGFWQARLPLCGRVHWQASTGPSRARSSTCDGIALLGGGRGAITHIDAMAAMFHVPAETPRDPDKPGRLRPLYEDEPIGSSNKPVAAPAPAVSPLQCNLIPCINALRFSGSKKRCTDRRYHSEPDHGTQTPFVHPAWTVSRLTPYCAVLSYGDSPHVSNVTPSSLSLGPQGGNQHGPAPSPTSFAARQSGLR